MNNAFIDKKNTSGIKTLGDVMAAYGGKEPLSQDKKICAIHPVSTWKEGYSRCFKGFKRNEDCKELCNHENATYSCPPDSQVCALVCECGKTIEDDFVSKR